MLHYSGLKRVVVVPRNGYLNRLQAVASASVIASGMGVPLYFTWETEEVAPAQADDLLSLAQSGISALDPKQLSALIGRSHVDMPRYLTVDEENGVAFLAGHDQGEQAFMSRLQDILRTSPAIHDLVIVAGGKFHFPVETDFDSKRRDFYSGIRWHPEIENRVEQFPKRENPYLGLHIRETDRSRQAPRLKDIERNLVDLAMQCNIKDVFIAADTELALHEWSTRVSELGLLPWISDTTNFNRSESGAARDALVDWRLLGGAQAIIYSAESSFGQEAAVMTAHPEWSRGLQARAGLRFMRDAQRIATSLARKLHNGSSRKQ